MPFKTYLKNLEKRKIISRKPAPIIPFILAIIILVLYFINPINNKAIRVSLLSLFIFTILFSVIHLIISKTLNK